MSTIARIPRRWFLVGWCGVASCGDGQEGGPGGPEAGGDAGGAHLDAADGSAPDDAVAGGEGDVAVGGDAAGDDAPDADVASDAGDLGVTTASFVSVAPRRIQAGDVLAYAPATEPAGLEVALLDGPDGARIDAGVLVWSSPDDGPSDVAFSLVARLGGREVGFQEFALRVNHAPAWSATPPTTASVGAPWTFEPRADDIDGDTVVVAVEDAPDWAAWDGTTLGGAPAVAGASRVALVADDGAGGRTPLSFDVQVSQSIRDLRASTGWLTTAGGALSLFGCCFEDGMTASFAGRPALLSRVNAAHVRVDLGLVEPGQWRVELRDEAGRVAGQTDELLVIPSIDATTGQLRTAAVGPELGVREAARWSPVAATMSPGDATHFVEPSEQGALVLEAQGVSSLPAVLGTGGAAAVVGFEPTFAPPGTRARAEIAGLPSGADVTATWSAGLTARCVWADGACTVVVPAGASGPVGFASGAGEVPRVVPATSDSEPASTPELTWANRVWVERDRDALVLIRQVGLENPASSLVVTGGSARVAWREGTWAVLAVRGSEPVVTVSIRVGARLSTPLTLVALATRTSADADSAFASDDGDVWTLRGGEVTGGGSTWTCACGAESVLVAPGVLYDPAARALVREGAPPLVVADTALTVAGVAGGLVFGTTAGDDLWALDLEGAARTVAGSVTEPGRFVRLAVTDRSGAADVSHAALDFHTVTRAGDDLFALGLDGRLARVTPSGAVVFEPVVARGCVHAAATAGGSRIVGSWGAGILLQSSGGDLAVAVAGRQCAVGLGGAGGGGPTRFVTEHVRVAGTAIEVGGAPLWLW